MEEPTRKKGYKAPKTESALLREQMIIYLWEKLRAKYGVFFDRITKKERISEIQEQTGLSTGHLKIIINAYVRGEIKYRPDLFASGEPETLTRI